MREMRGMRGPDLTLQPLYASKYTAFQEAGLPDGVFNVVVGGDTFGAMCEAMNTKK
jgi:acyl-CoA reductase-like NAD-dependent aldehyde dehydrogenase